MGDSEIVELYWRRDEGAIQETRRKYGRYLAEIARGILSSREDGEEIVNDTCLRAWNSIPPSRPDSLAAYLGKIARRLSIDALRSGWSRRAGWPKWMGAAACLALAVCVGLGLPRTGRNLPKLPLSEGMAGPNGMGYEGYLAYDISELVSATPWRETDGLKTLPVYRNPVAYDRAGAPVGGVDLEAISRPRRREGCWRRAGISPTCPMDCLGRSTWRMWSSSTCSDGGSGILCPITASWWSCPRRRVKTG